MSTKSFTEAKKPGPRPTPEEISAFEETGQAMAGGRKAAASAEPREHGNTENHEGEKTDMSNAGNAGPLEHSDTEMRKDASTASRKQGNAETCDAVDTETQPVDTMVRLTIDLPESVHTRFKAACAIKRRKMVEEVRGFIEVRTAELESGSGKLQ